MFIDRGRFSSARELIDYINIDETIVHNVNVDKFLTTIWTAVHKIWQNIDATVYTNHDLEQHSAMIITYFMKFGKIYEWSNWEKLLFACAAMIHDIGMQYNEWGLPADGLRQFPRVRLPVDEVRKRHVDFMFDLVKAQYDGPYELQSPAAFCDLHDNWEKEALFLAANIAACHSGKKYLDQMESVGWATQPSKGRPYYRPRLLACMLRLCDELDGNWYRIKEPEKFDSWEMDNISKAHWLSCLFVDRVELDCNTDQYRPVANISLKWQIPRSAVVFEPKIRMLLDTMRIRKINAEVNTFKETLYKYDEHHSIIIFIVEPLDAIPFQFTLGIPSNFEEILDSAISAFPRPGEKSDREPGSDQHPSVTPWPGIPSSLVEKLVAWFEQNKAPRGHYELLNNNEHTDTYLNCRSLTAEHSLLRDLADAISAEHFGHNIDCVLAVGTSAIPLATNVAYRLQCCVTFTFSQMKLSLPMSDEAAPERFQVGPDGIPVYMPPEIIPSIREGENILIIDDVISGGSVATSVLDLLENLGCKPNQTFHHSIFRLGDRDYYADPRIATSYYWVLHIHNIEYFTSPDECPHCGIEPLVKEDQVF